MKLGILSESPADTAAIQILAEAILRRPIEVVSSGRLRPGGWSAVIDAINVEFKHLYFQTDAEGLIVVVDSDDSPVHEASHSAVALEGCRTCKIQNTVASARVSLRQRPQGGPLQVAIGLPVPAIEAWFRCGHDPHAAEDRFVRDFRSGHELTSVRRQLKRDVYGTDRPSLRMETEFAIKEATRLATEIDRLRTQFPRGFGSFYETLVTWR